MRGVGQTPKDVAVAGIRRGHKLSEHELRVAMELPRKPLQRIAFDITSGRQLDRTLDQVTQAWLDANS